MPHFFNFARNELYITGLLLLFLFNVNGTGARVSGKESEEIFLQFLPPAMHDALALYVTC